MIYAECQMVSFNDPGEGEYSLVLSLVVMMPSQ